MKCLYGWAASGRGREPKRLDRRHPCRLFGVSGRGREPKRAFTLVELLVVIAIISILAAIVVPRVITYIGKARATKAQTEIKGFELALTKMLTDCDKRDFGHVFEWTSDPPLTLRTISGVAGAMEIYTNAFYCLLRNGRDAQASADWPGELQLRDGVKDRLGVDYVQIGKDPWGQLYQFYPGPWKAPDPDFTDFADPDERKRPPFVSYRTDTGIPGGPVDEEGDTDALASYTDTDGPRNVGFPASKNVTIYIYSKGANLLSNQGFDPGFDDDAADQDTDTVGGGDDINNWDNTASWTKFYS